MKKLMTILSATATLFAFCAVNGDEVPWRTGISFEGYTGAFDPARDDDGTTTGQIYWYSGDTDPTYTLTNYEGEASTTTPIDKRPDMFKDEVNGTYLMVETSAKTTPLFRTALPFNGEFAPVTNTADKTIHLDTLVKFTPAESVFEASDLSGGDKIAIEYVEREEERDPTTDEITVHALTNFVIRAGYLGGSPVNYVAKLPDNFNKDKDVWHRLTVRTVLDIDGNDSVGFVVYVDEEALEYDTEAITRTGSEFAASAGDFTAQGVAANFYRDDYRALYPSAIQSGNDKLTISAAGFSGNGAIDDVTFSSKIDFIDDNEKVPVTFVVPVGVTSITVDGGEIDLSNPTTNLEANVTAFDLVVTVDSASGYVYTGISGPATNELGQVIVQKPAMEITILTSRNNVSYINDNDETVYCATLNEAFLYAKDGSTITLPYNNAPFTYNVADWEDASFESYHITGDITLDLNGNVIDGGIDIEDAALFEIDGGSSLTVIDSSAGNTGAISYDTEYGVFYALGTCTIGAASGDNGPTINGYLAAAEDEGDNVWLVRGKFDAASNGAAKFLWDEYLGDEDGTITSTATLSGDYWVVEQEGGSEPKEIPVPTAIEGLIYNKGEQTGVAAGTGYTLTGNVGTNATGYTAVATLEAGYAWVGGSTDPTNIEWSISMKGVTPTIVLNPTSAQFDPNKTTVGAYVTSVAAYDGEDLLTENLDYLVSGLTEEVTEAGEYKVWVVQKGWDPGQNYMITNSQYATLTITAGGAYPTYIPAEDAEAKAKYDTWATTYGADTDSAYATAFLLNIAPGAADQTLEPVAITISGSTVTIAANQNLKGVNGKVYIKTAGTLAGLAGATWSEATLNETTGAIEMTSNGTAAFFKIKVDF